MTPQRSHYIHFYKCLAEFLKWKNLADLYSFFGKKLISTNEFIISLTVISVFFWLVSMYFLSINSTRIKAISIFIIKKYKNYPNIRFYTKLFIPETKSPHIGNHICGVFFAYNNRLSGLFFCVCFRIINHKICHRSQNKAQPKSMVYQRKRAYQTNQNIAVNSNAQSLIIWSFITS